MFPEPAGARRRPIRRADPVTCCPTALRCGSTRLTATSPLRSSIAAPSSAPSAIEVPAPIVVVEVLSHRRAASIVVDLLVGLCANILECQPSHHKAGLEDRARPLEHFEMVTCIKLY